MKNLLLILASITTLIANAQTSVYFPFPDSATVWRQYSYRPGNCCCSGYPCLSEDDFVYFLNGDTLIGALVYKKIYQTGNGVTHVLGPPNCPPWCSNNEYYYYNNIYSGCIRQDTAQRKVFYMPPGYTQDTLLYEFNLNIGDTLAESWISYSPLNYVTGIDSILIDGAYHKCYELSTSSSPYEVALIEGIGGSLGLLSPLFTNQNVSQFCNRLLCVTVNGLSVYPDTSTVCNLITKINEVDNNLSFSIYPNPLTDILNIKLNNFTTAEIILYDIASRKLLQQQFTNFISLNTEHLAKGIYIYEVRDKNGVCKKGKVVKN
ncbi:MAG TPA: T9SS type A sorting domain-containing protein [Bacteroidia bacterium]|nr:T9SS type A sorting domain-containing protein [Bacteroidia bacterium]